MNVSIANTNDKICCRGMYGMSSEQKLLLRQYMTSSQILRYSGIRFVRIRKQLWVRYNGRCELCAIMFYFSWNGKDDCESSDRLLEALDVLGHDNFSENLIIRLLDPNMTFQEVTIVIGTNEGSQNGVFAQVTPSPQKFDSHLDAADSIAHKATTNLYHHYLQRSKIQIYGSMLVTVQRMI